jgi:hypothetical protein
MLNLPFIDEGTANGSGFAKAGFDHRVGSSAFGKDRIKPLATLSP